MDGPLHEEVELIQKIDVVPRILDAVRKITGMRFATIARVTQDRWIACAVLDSLSLNLEVGDELSSEVTICKTVRASRDPVVIDHASRDATVRDNAMLKAFGAESFLSFPITLADGSCFGTLCALDPDPRPLHDMSAIQLFPFFADLIAGQIDNMSRIDDTNRTLATQQADSELREQFIAVIGHDLRNPAAAVQSGTRMLLKMPLDEKASTIVKLMQGSAMRMNGMIDNLLDFAQGRLGGGMTVERVADVDLGPLVMQVVDELRSASNRVIETDFAGDARIDCDPQRIAQLLSNLVGNAVTHSPEDRPIVVSARRTDATFTLTVANEGPPIPDDARDALFKPFSRGDEPGHRQGLGLGLYIASEIARAHGGTLACESGEDGTRFTLEMTA